MLALYVTLVKLNYLSLDSVADALSIIMCYLNNSKPSMLQAFCPFINVKNLSIKTEIKVS